VLLISHAEFPGRQFHVLVLSALYGACLMVSADSFLTLFLGIELLSLPVYVLVLLAFRTPQSAEAALKYLVLGGAASATMLMGASILFGWSGSLGISAFTRAAASGDAFAITGAVLVLVAFFLKAAIAPFHTWAPDAYESASVPVTAFMATIVKAAVVLAAARLFATAELSAPMVTLIAFLPLGRSPGATSPPCASRAAPHDRVLVDRARGLPLLRIPRRRADALQGGGLLRARLRVDEHPRLRLAPAAARRRRRAIASTT
jgi:NADH-quinone oxidoreductase subunit N